MQRKERHALVTGILGQDGWYLAERLVKLGYSVVGTTCRDAGVGELRFGSTAVRVVRLSLGDPHAVDELLRAERPDELYNLAARASSAQLFDDPLATADINGVAVARLLESIRKHSPATRFCQASSSEVFAGASASPQDERTCREPRNAYGAAKAFADHLVAAYRETYGLFAASAILFPHESPRRSTHFLVRKVTRGAAMAEAGCLNGLVLGNLDAVRDWGYAPDYVDAMQRMLQQPVARDTVLATGEPHTVEDVCAVAFDLVGLKWRDHVTVDKTLQRAPESVLRIGDPTLARRELDWRPSVRFEQLIALLVDAARRELQSARTEGLHDR